MYDVNSTLLPRAPSFQGPCPGLIALPNDAGRVACDRSAQHRGTHRAVVGGLVLRSETAVTADGKPVEFRPKQRRVRINRQERRAQWAKRHAFLERVRQARWITSRTHA